MVLWLQMLNIVSASQFNGVHILAFACLCASQYKNHQFSSFRRSYRKCVLACLALGVAAWIVLLVHHHQN